MSDQQLNEFIADNGLVNTIGQGLINASPIQVRRPANVVHTTDARQLNT